MRARGRPRRSAHQTTLTGNVDPAEHEPSPVGERVDIVAQPDAQLRHQPSDRTRDARSAPRTSRSSGTVTFRFQRGPATIRTRPPYRSTSAESSVPSNPSSPRPFVRPAPRPRGGTPAASARPRAAAVRVLRARDRSLDLLDRCRTRVPDDHAVRLGRSGQAPRTPWRWSGSTAARAPWDGHEAHSSGAHGVPRPPMRRGVLRRRPPRPCEVDRVNDRLSVLIHTLGVRHDHYGVDRVAPFEGEHGVREYGQSCDERELLPRPRRSAHRRRRPR